MDEHAHRDELSQRGRNAPHWAKLSRCSVRAVNSCIRGRMAVSCRVECLDGGDGEDSTVYDGSNDSGLLARGCGEEKRGLRRCLG